MPFKKGDKRPAKAGRKPGIPNKATTNAREAIAEFVDGNADRLQGWLDAIAKADGPKAAMACFVDLLEYHVPKLGRTELTGANGEPLAVGVVRFGEGQGNRTGKGPTVPKYK